MNRFIVYALVFGALLVCGVSAGQTDGEEEIEKIEPAHRMHVGNRVIQIEAIQERGAQATEARRVPGFEMRGFEGEVKKESSGDQALDIGFEFDREQTERLRVVLFNLSDDLVAITRVKPSLQSTSLPWRTGLSLPLELDWEEQAVLLDGAPEKYFEIKTFTLTLELESGGVQKWTVSAGPAE